MEHKEPSFLFSCSRRHKMKSPLFPFGSELCWVCSSKLMLSSSLFTVLNPEAQRNSTKDHDYTRTVMPLGFRHISERNNTPLSSSLFTTLDFCQNEFYINQNELQANAVLIQLTQMKYYASHKWWVRIPWNFQVVVLKSKQRWFYSYNYT